MTKKTAKKTAKKPARPARSPATERERVAYERGLEEGRAEGAQTIVGGIILGILAFLGRPSVVAALGGEIERRDTEPKPSIGCASRTASHCFSIGCVLGKGHCGAHCDGKGLKWT